MAKTHYELLQVGPEPKWTHSIAEWRAGTPEVAVLREAAELVTANRQYVYELVVVTADGDAVRSVKVWEAQPQNRTVLGWVRCEAVLKNGKPCPHKGYRHRAGDRVECEWCAMASWEREAGRCHE